MDEEDLAAKYYLVFHGKTEWNEKGCLQGSTDKPLTPAGVEETEKLAKKLSGINFDAILYPEHQYAVETAEILGKQMDVEFVTLNALHARDWGDFEGMSIDQLTKEHGDHFRKMTEVGFVGGRIDKSENPFHEIETLPVLGERISRALKQQLPRFHHKKVATVLNEDAVRALLAMQGLVIKKLTPMSIIVLYVRHERIALVKAWNTEIEYPDPRIFQFF